MSLKTVQKSFRFTETEARMLEELVELEKLQRLHYLELHESDVDHLNQTKVLTTLIRLAHEKLLTDLSKDAPEKLAKLNIQQD
ncbi:MULTISPECIES: hypothetical protein [unclassified Exiguobacterium]|uniref:hypothetical protein n=1 Tax=unclassified Exiguobacterium TaxID=2644629 RepID=UPI001BE52005|nr:MULTISPECIES: hypothetical protein [unclassified Exiguobacterium]